MEKIDIILFGDQSQEIGRYFRDVLHASRHCNLVFAFLEQANAALACEFASQSRRRRDDLPHFTTIQELGREWSQSRPGSVVLATVLLTTAQLVDYIGYRESQPSSTLASKSTNIVGLCTGQLVASAVACADSIHDFVPLAVEAVCTAFRLGVHVDETASTLHLSGEHAESWAYSFRDVRENEVQEILDEFHQERKTHTLSQAYVSAVTTTSVTISGPPRSLVALLESSEKLKALPRFQLPINGPYHASHLFEEAVLAEILEPSSWAKSQDIASRPCVRQLLSTKTGEPIAATTFSELLETVVRDVLENPLRLDLVVNQLVSNVKAENSSCRVIAIGPTNSGNAIATAIQHGSGSEAVAVDFASRWAEKDQETFEASQRSTIPGIAIVGYSGRFPGADSAEALWDVLEQGLDLHKEIPTDRFNPATHVDPNGKRRNTSHTPYGCFIDNPGYFDPTCFNMSPREAKQTDPMQRLFLMTAYEALEMSGYVPNRTSATHSSRIGTICGQTSDDYREVNAGHHVGTYFTTGTIRAFGPGRVNYFFKLDGPSYNIDTACSSSLAAIQIACSSIWAGEADTFIAGGVNVMTAPDQYAGLSRGQFLSKTGPCRTFDNEADGYCRGESIGTVILKRLDLAEADKDPIYGVIRSAATNHSANAVSITHPHAPTQETLYRHITQQARLSPQDIDYIEMHGTGTQAGDFIEMTSVGNVFAPEVNPRPSEHPLYVGAVKANVGHGEAASGVTALIKALLMFRNNAIPPHVGIKGDMNENFPDLDARNIKIAFNSVPFRGREGRERRMLVNNFSAAGGNTAMILEEYFPKLPSQTDPRQAHVVAVSGRNANHLRTTIEGLLDFLDFNPGTSVSNLSYTTTARRIHRKLRVAVVGETIEDIKDKLSKYLTKEDADLKASPIKEMAYAFTGQGALYASMARDLLENVDTFRHDIEKFDAIGQRHGFPSFLPLLDGVIDDATSLSPVQTQLGLVCMQIALARLYKTWGVSPSILIGHSLGEYAALHVAGVLSVSDTIYLVGTRASLLTECCTPGTHQMLAVKASASEIQDHLSDAQVTFEIACRNAPKETVLSGSVEDMDSASSKLSDQGFKCTKIPVPYAFHSAQIDVILERFEQATNNVVFHPATIPLISPKLEAVIDVGKTISGKYLCDHARDPVNFMAGLEHAQGQGKLNDGTVWVELGPHPLCSGMIKGTIGVGHVQLPTMRRDQNIWQTSATTLADLHSRGFAVDWSEYHNQFNDSLELVELPRPIWELDDYWLPYQNDWTLTKGDTEEEEYEVIDEATFKPTTTMHLIVEEDFGEDAAEVLFQTDMNSPKLRALVLGHLVNGTGLVSSSVYADMAMTAADYIHQRLRPHSIFCMDIADMTVSKPVILSTADEGEDCFPLHVFAKADLRNGEARIEYTTGQDKFRKLHATCNVRFGDASKWESRLARTSHLIKNRIKNLDSGVAKGTSQKLRQRMVYKLFSALVAYSDPFRGMQSVVLGDDGYEGASHVTFQTSEEDGHFVCSPFWIDSLVHLSGFVLNANDSTDSDKFVFISHGWESMQILEPLQQDKSYRSYVSMIPEKKSTMMIGDVYAFDGDVLIAFVGGVRFQRIPRKQLNMLLPPVDGSERITSTSNSRDQSRAASRRPKRSMDQSQSPTPASRLSGSLSRRQSVSRSSLSRVTSRTDLARLKTAVPAKQKALDVIAEEIGISSDQLHGDKEFSDLGVDSLLSLSILGRLREDGINLPETTFTDCPTVDSFNECLQEYVPAEAEDVAAASSPGSAPRSATTSSRPTTRNSSPTASIPTTRTGHTTPTTNRSRERSASKVVNSAPKNSSIAQLLRPIISEEMGIPEDKLTDTSDLAGLGMDSLMSLSVVVRLREETDLDPRNDLFAENIPLGEVEEILAAAQQRSKHSTRTPASNAQNERVKSSPQGGLGKRASTSRNNEHQLSRSATPKSAATPKTYSDGSSAKGTPRKMSNGSRYSSPRSGSPSNAKLSESALLTKRSASSVLLQSATWGMSSTLFLLPDGSGSATAYKTLPKLSSTLKVYGLNCPFLRNPEEFNCGIDGVARLYIEEMKRRQSKGPYLLGGWSAGGVIAYEMTRQLLDAGEAVEHLFLIDAPCPLTIPPMPGSLIQFFNKIGLFTQEDGSSPPPWLLKHFESSVQNLKKYNPMPLVSNCLPKTTVMWGRYGVCRDLDSRPEGDDDVSSKHWILDDRSDFGGNGWEELVGDVVIDGHPVAGNHFSMMEEQNIGEVADILRDVIETKQ